MIRPSLAATVVLALTRAAVAAPQDAPQPEVDHARQERAHRQHPASPGLFAPREASGTSWLPDDTFMAGMHATAGPWQMMAHGVVFAQFLYESGEEHRRSHQAGSINWVMGMARRPAGSGWFGARAMMSLEPWTITGCGYPDLLATGETCEGDSIHDRQHPHDLAMELAVEYDRPVGPGLRWHAYGGLVGEPALGPPAFPHRLSAMANPIAPISHHWLDATHITFGVITAGLSTRRWRAEASAFNGREPDEKRANVETDPLDSFSGRLMLTPTSALAVQVSGGRLNDAETTHGGLPRVDIVRVTASAIYHRALPGGGVWATTVAWGANRENGRTSQAVLVESSAGLGNNTVFGRMEVNGKPADDLHVHESTDIFTVGKLQFGFVNYRPSRRGLRFGSGATVSAALLPPWLAPRYGGRIAPGFGVFLTIGPTGHAAG